MTVFKFDRTGKKIWPPAPFLPIFVILHYMCNNLTCSNKLTVPLECRLGLAELKPRLVTWSHMTLAFPPPVEGTCESHNQWAHSFPGKHKSKTAEKCYLEFLWENSTPFFCSKIPLNCRPIKYIKFSLTMTVLCVIHRDEIYRPIEWKHAGVFFTKQQVGFDQRTQWSAKDLQWRILSNWKQLQSKFFTCIRRMFQS